MSSAQPREAPPPRWREELDERLARVQPADTIRGLFIKGLMDAVRALGDEALVRRCIAEAGGEEQILDFFMYPLGVDLRLTYTAVGLLEARTGKGLDEVLELLGRQATADFLGSIVGRTLRMLAGSDPRRILNGLPSAYAVSVSFGEREVVWTGPRSAHLTMRREFLPTPFHEGTLRAVLESVNVRGRVQGRQLSLLDSEYEVSWE